MSDKFFIFDEDEKYPSQISFGDPNGDSLPAIEIGIESIEHGIDRWNNTITIKHAQAICDLLNNWKEE